MKIKTVFLGETRYTKPLDPTSRKKFSALQTLGEIYVIAFSRDTRPRHFFEYAHFYLMPNPPFVLLRYGMLLTLGSVLLLWCILRHNTRVVIAQSHYGGYVAAWWKLIARTCFKKKLALIVESHGDFENTFFLYHRVLFKRLHQTIMSRMIRFALEHADVLRGVSNSTIDQLKTIVPKTPIVKFPAWTDLDVFLKNQENAIPYKRRNTLLYTGSIIPLKGIHLLIEAFSKIHKEFPDIELHIVGARENKTYAENLKQEMQESGLKHRIHFHHPLPQQALAHLMSRAKIFVLPSLSEGLPRVILEAMACGVPIIASRVGGIPEMITNGRNGFLVQPGDSSELAEKLSEMLSDTTRAETMGQHAQVDVQSFFSKEKYIEGYKNLFAQAIYTMESELKNDLCKN